MKAKITFSVSGYIVQYVEITKEGVTLEKLQDMLNEGTALTTVQDNGTIDITATGEVIGTMTEGMGRKSEVEYADFEVGLA